METPQPNLSYASNLQADSNSKTPENPKDQLINEIAASVRVNVIECTPKNAVDIAKLAVQHYQEQTGVKIDQTNCLTAKVQIMERDLACLNLSDATQARLIRKFITTNFSPESELYQSCNHLLIWFIQSKIGMNESLTVHLAEVLWEKAITRFKMAANPQPDLGSQRLYNLLIKNFLNYITAQTNQGPRQRAGVAENLAINRLYPKVFNGDLQSISILKEYLYGKLLPIFYKEYQSPWPETQQLVDTVVQQVLHDIETKECIFDPETKKSFLTFVLKEYLQIRPELKMYNYIDVKDIGREDQRIDDVIDKDELRTQRSVKLNTLTEVFRLVLRCGGYPHEQLSYLFVDFLTTKPDQMVEKGLHEMALNELRESFWYQIEGRISKYNVNSLISQRFLISLDPLDHRLKLKVNALTSLVSNNKGKIAAPVTEMAIAQTRLADYHTFSKRDINMAISFWKDNVRQSLARVLGIPSLNFNKIIYSSDLDKAFTIRRKTSRNQCKLKEIAPCGGKNGTGCLVFEVVKNQRLKKKLL
jgi:hypothetical protein